MPLAACGGRPELAAQLRLNGIDDLSRVKRALIESEGNISVIPVEKGDSPESAPTKESEVIERFLKTLQELNDLIDRHESMAAEHQGMARTVRDLLQEKGFRPRSPLKRPGQTGSRTREPSSRTEITHAQTNPSQAGA